MDREQARVVLESFIERIERDRQSGKWRLEGIVTEKERAALLAVLEMIGGDITRLVYEEQLPEPRAKNIFTVPLNLDSLGRDEPNDEETLLCLDFGTAMSKAFATRESDLELIDLPIGRQAGQVHPVYALFSSVYITEGGRILFGHRAVSESTHGDASGRKRFDSLKDILCKDVVCDLDEAPLEKEYNPTDIPLTKGDMVTLYLAYFTDMATSALQERFELSRYVRRRFTRPVLPPDRAAWAEEQLRKLLARAQILADTLHGQWNDGIRVELAQAILFGLREQEELPKYLIDHSMLEPVAAVASRLRHFEGKVDDRRLLMVVDVGAGTIDFALFAEFQSPGKPLTVWGIPGSVQVLRQAGDKVDVLLRRFIMKKADLSPSDPDFSRIDAGLSLRIRPLKEALFQSGEVGYTLENDATGVVRLEEFLSFPGVVELEKAIHAKFMEALEGVDPSWIEELGNGVLPIVFTGGGANLPMVRSLADRQIYVHGQMLQCRGATPTPAWIKEEYPELEDEYLHLAVAIGGASRDIPLLAPTTFQEFGGLHACGRKIEPALKGA